MWKAFLFIFVIIGGIIAVLVFVKGPQFAPPPPFVLPPESVTSDVAEEMEWENLVTAVGTLRAYQGITVSSEVPGTLSAIHFESGQEVETGQLLFELDTSAEQAQLESARASAELADVNLRRARELRESRSIAQSSWIPRRLGLKRLKRLWSNCGLPWRKSGYGRRSMAGLGSGKRTWASI